MDRLRIREIEEIMVVVPPVAGRIRRGAALLEVALD